MRTAWLMCCAVGIAPAALADPTSFNDAIARAGREAPSVAAGKPPSSARLLVRPAGQLPDPQLALDLEDIPITGADRFRLDRDEMTMLNVGIMQDVPSDASRRARQQMAQADVRVTGAALDISRLEARVAAATAWLKPSMPSNV